MPARRLVLRSFLTALALATAVNEGGSSIECRSLSAEENQLHHLAVVFIGLN
jgi:hypothetical protein